MHSSTRVALLARTLLVAGAALVVTACSGGSSGSSPVPFNQYACDGGTQTQLARPLPNSGGNSGVTSIEIVANNNNNQLGQSYQQYDLLIAPAGAAPNQGYVTNALTPVSDTSGPHPYGSDFFYSGTIQGGSLPFGQTFSVYLNAFNSNCSPVYEGSFST